MKKYRMLTAGERTIKGDEYNYGHGFEDMSHEEGYIVSAPDEGYIRRPVPYEGKVAFLVTYSPTIRVVIDTTGLTDEQIDNKLVQAAQAEFCYNHAEHMNNFGDNIDWDQTREDTEVPFVEPEPKIHGKYRMLEIGEEILEGDEYQKRDGTWKVVSANDKVSVPNYRRKAIDNFRRPIAEPRYRMLEAGETIMAGDEMKDKEATQWFKCNATVGCTVDEDGPYEYRRPITESLYRPFKEGDVIEEGDQFLYKGEWDSFSSLCYGEEINAQYIPTSRKLIN